MPIEIRGMREDGTDGVSHCLDEENMGITMPLSIADQQEVGKLVTIIVSLNTRASTEEIEIMFKDSVEEYGSFVAANTAFECREDVKIEAVNRH